MSKTVKIWLITAASVILIGCIVFVSVMSILKWDFKKLSTNVYEIKNYDIYEEYSNISIISDSSDIVFVASENSIHSVECYEQKNLKYSVTVKDDTLMIEVADERKWYERMGINVESPKITIYIPQGEYGALSIKSSTGDIDISKDFKFESIDISESTGDVTNYASVLNNIRIKTTAGNIFVENVSANLLDLSVTTGDVNVTDVTCESDITIGVSTGKANLTNITCNNLISSGNTGDISLKNVIADKQFSVKRTSGDIKLDGCDSAEIFMETHTGDVVGTLLSEKVFITKTDTGRVDVPNSVTGGRCEITTDTGDIKISIL